MTTCPQKSSTDNSYTPSAFSGGPLLGPAWRVPLLALPLFPATRLLPGGEVPALSTFITFHAGIKSRLNLGSPVSLPGLAPRKDAGGCVPDTWGG